MSISERTIKILWSRSGCICAFPGCEIELVYPDTNNIIGEICHIFSPENNGPRFDKNFPENKLNEEENLILLCPNHHTLVDKDIDNFNVSVLREIKRKHEDLIRSRLRTGEPWDYEVSGLYYINIPRLLMLAGISGKEFSTDLIEIESLHSLGLELVRIMSEFEGLVKEIKPNAIKIEKIKELDINLTGLTISFNNSFRTKNLPYLDDFNKGNFKMIGDLKKDPHIYRVYEKFKLFLNIDPRWITTTTSFCNFKAGWIYINGFCVIKHVDVKNKLIIASPLIIGIPKSPLDFLFR